MARLTLVFLALAACTSDKPETGDTAPEGWTLLAEDHPSAFLSIWGSGVDDVWAVGADAGSGPAVAHYDGSAWTTVDTGTSGDLWWVTSTSAGMLWMGGADGRVLSYVPSSGQLEAFVLDEAITVFGVWGAADDDVWAVGGDITRGSDAAQIWHYDGHAWTRATIPAEAAGAVAIYKVWGRSASDVYAVGTGGVGVHWDGTSWTDVPTGTDRNLFTVHGTASEEIAVGGQFSGTIVAGAGTWTDETPEMAPQFNGVYAGGEGGPVAVGAGGAVCARFGAGWEPDPRGVVTAYDLHAVWVDAEGGIWTVGGKLSSFPLDRGIVAYGGGRAVPPL
ncbi:MAG: hypothetical protein ACK4YP_00390 [Myxococcota bacterium]